MELGAQERIEELEAALARVQESEAQLVREFRNYRRHAEADQARAGERARARLLAELGETVQALEQAAGLADTDPEAVRDGIALVARRIKAVFDRHGLWRIPTSGEVFDPSVHEAVFSEELEGVSRGTVVREVTPGFRTEDEVIRPAKVSVAA